MPRLSELFKALQWQILPVYPTDIPIPNNNVRFQRGGGSKMTPKYWTLGGRGGVKSGHKSSDIIDGRSLTVFIITLPVPLEIGYHEIF